MDQITEKIKKLIAKAESSNELGNSAEAEAFARKAQQLIAEYAIDASKLKGTPKQEVVYTKIPYSLLSKPHEGLWLYSLYSVVAKHNFCYALRCQGKQGESIGIIGELTYTNLVDSIAQSLIARLRSAALRAMKEDGFTGNRNAYKRAFFMGAVKGINYQMELQREALATTHDTFMPIVRSHQQKIQDFVNENLNLKMGSAQRSLKDEAAKQRGFAEGKNISLTRGNLAYSSNQKRLG